MKLSTIISVCFVIFAKKILANPKVLNNSAVVLKTAKACAQLNGLDFISSTSIYIKGNFKELKNDQKGFLKCISDNLKLWAEHDEPDYDKIMQHTDFLVRGDKKGLREKIETCIASSNSVKSFDNRLHDAYECFWTSTKGLGRQQVALLEQLKIDLNKKI